VQLRQLCHFFRADPDYGRRVATKLGINVDQVLKEMGRAHTPVSV
jgi:catalase